MKAHAETGIPLLSEENDKRVTKIGKVLRKYRLDELPQFWNVLKGDMSLVGPRPEREYFIRQIVERAPYYVLLHQIRPGITSWGMVKYGYARNVDENDSPVEIRYSLLGKYVFAGRPQNYHLHHQNRYYRKRSINKHI